MRLLGLLFLAIVCFVEVAPIQAKQDAPSIPRCPETGLGSLNLCRVERIPDDLEARLSDDVYAVWVEGDELTFAYRGEADRVRLCCGIQTDLVRVGGTDLWSLTLRIRDLSQAVISYAFTPIIGDNPPTILAAPQLWRGEDAPPPPHRNRLFLRGEIREVEIESESLSEPRGLTVYLPPDHDPTRRYPVIYAADGQNVGGLAQVLEPLIHDGTVPPVLLVGVHSPMTMVEGRDLRADEYIPGFNRERFEAHERFFTEEVRSWAAETLGASTGRDENAVFGYSNGGVFAAAMGVRRPDLYGYALAFSLGIPVDSGQRRIDTAFYMVAGTLEEGFITATRQTARRLQSGGADVVLRERVSGHDYVMWEEEFVNAVVWAFGEDSR